MSFMTDKAIDNLRPSLFVPNIRNGSEIDAIVQQSFRQDLRAIETLMSEEYYLDRLASAIYYRIPYFNSMGRDLSTMNALELGCGRGLKAIPWSRLFRRYWGTDLESASIELGRRLVAAAGHQNIDLLNANAVDVLRDPRRYGIKEKIDCVVMYAVLEHLTLDERRYVLEALRELLGEDGLLIISETPNRLIPHDGHSTYLHFFQSLPTELALKYISRSTRSDARAVAVASGDRTEALYRFGQGASYHEFDLFFCDSTGGLPAIRSDGWSAWPAFDEPIRRDEVVLADYFRLHGNVAHPAFARYWLELAFDFSLPRSATRSAPVLLAPESAAPLEHIPRPECWTLDLVICAADQQVAYDLGGLRPRLLQFDFAASAGGFGIFDPKGHQIAEYDLTALAKARHKRWHSRCTLDLSCLGEREQIVVRPTSPKSRLAIECLVADRAPSA